MHDAQYSWHSTPPKRRRPFSWLHSKYCHLALLVSVLIFILSVSIAYRYVQKSEHQALMAEPVNTLSAQYAMLLYSPLLHHDTKQIQRYLEILGKHPVVADAAIYDVTGKQLAGLHSSWSLVAQVHPIQAYMTPIHNEGADPIGMLRIATRTQPQLSAFYQQLTSWKQLIMIIGVFSLLYGVLLVFAIKRYAPLIRYIKPRIIGYFRRS